MLAPLLDMMTTRDIARRFTAAQALRFVEDIRRPLTAAQLATPHRLGTPYDLSNPRDFLRRMRYKYTEVSLKIIYLNNDIELSNARAAVGGHAVC